MELDALQLFFGLGLLLFGGQVLVTNASALASGLGVSKLAIGLTVVAFGTSAPELAVNLTAALEGSSAISFGNVIGSNVANVGLIVGLAALVRPLTVDGVLINREIPMMLLASGVAFAVGVDLVGGGGGAAFGRGDGVVLLLLFTVFLGYTVRDALRAHRDDPLLEQAEAQPVAPRPGIARPLGLTGVGLVGLVLGGRLCVDGAVGVAAGLGIRESIVAVSVIAVGTSLPELSTSLLAARRGETELAIGNVVGSNLFNLLFVLALSSLIRPVPVPDGGLVDLAVMLGMGAALWVACADRSGRCVTRVEGALMLTAYLVYVTLRVS